MAGRGRGRGASMTFNTELLGVGRGQGMEPTPSSSLEPPPLFPPLPARPKLPLNKAEHAYLITTHNAFVNRMIDSPHHITGSQKLDLDWSRFPSELSAKPANKKRKTGGGSRHAPNKVARSHGDLSKHLDKLEQSEKKGGVGGGGGKEEAKKDDDSDKEDEDGSDKDAEEDGEEADEEMDEDGDYARDYFDNGEGYLDDDEDNLDEGGIY